MSEPGAPRWLTDHFANAQRNLPATAAPHMGELRRRAHRRRQHTRVVTTGVMAAVAVAAAGLAVSLTTGNGHSHLKVATRPGTTVTGPPASQPPSRQAAPCAGRQLKTTEKPVAPGHYISGATGHSAAVILFQNASRTTCTLTGYPEVSGTGPGGVIAEQATPTAHGYMGGLSPSTATPPTVTVAPGQEASALVEGAVAQAATSCRALSGLTVSAPGANTTVSLPAAPSGCHLQVHPVVPGTTGRQAE